MKIRIDILMICILTVPFYPAYSQLESMSILVQHDDKNVFYKDFAISPNDEAYILLNEVDPVTNRPSAILSKVNSDGSEEWQNQLIHSQLDLYPDVIMQASNGDLIIAVTDYHNQDGFLGSNMLVIRMDSQGQILNGRRIGNTKSQIIQDILPLENDQFALLTHDGDGDGYGTAICVLDANSFSILSTTYLKGNELYTYLNKIIPLSNGQFIGLGNEIDEDLSSAALIALFDEDWQLLETRTIKVPDLRSVGTHAIYENGSYDIYLDVQNEGVILELDQNFELLKSEKLGFLTIDNHFDEGQTRYYFSNSLNAILAYENDVPQYTKILGGDNGFVELFEPTVDKKHIWGLNNTLQNGRWGTQIARQPLANIYTCGSFFWSNFMPLSFPVTFEQSDMTVGSVQYVISDVTPNLSSVSSDIAHNMTCSETILSSVESQHESQLSIYPNPVSDKIMLSEPITHATLYDLNGQIVLQQSGKMKSLDVSTIAPGFYILATNLGVLKVSKL